ncbi:hypothetical protein ACOSQ3_013027 [Xanthoceras sorbifolium]
MLSKPHKSQQLEREALLSSGWWNNTCSSDHQHHCKWDGITCNSAASITKICLDNKSIKGELGHFNFSCFLQTLESFSVWRNNLSGNIPSQIAALSKLQRLDLGGNNLSGARYKL